MVNYPYTEEKKSGQALFMSIFFDGDGDGITNGYNISFFLFLNVPVASSKHIGTVNELTKHITAFSMEVD